MASSEESNGDAQGRSNSAMAMAISLKAAGIGTVASERIHLTDIEGGEDNNSAEVEQDPRTLLRPDSVRYAAAMTMENEKEKSKPLPYNYRSSALRFNSAGDQSAKTKESKSSDEDEPSNTCDGDGAKDPSLMPSEAIAATTSAACAGAQRSEEHAPRPEVEGDPRAILRPDSGRCAAQMPTEKPPRAKIKESKFSLAVGQPSRTDGSRPREILPPYINGESEEPLPFDEDLVVSSEAQKGTSNVGAHRVPGVNSNLRSELGETHLSEITFSSVSPSLNSPGRTSSHRRGQERARIGASDAGGVLVSAHLVEDGQAGGFDDDEGGVLTVPAEEVSSSALYLGKRRFKLSRVVACIAMFVTVIAVAITLSVILTRQEPSDRAIPGPEDCSMYVPNNVKATVGPVTEDKICGGYSPDWDPTPCLQNVHPNYNLVFLFAGRPTDSLNGSFSFSPPTEYGGEEQFRSVVQADRADHNRTYILSVGGQNNGFRTSNRDISRTFVDSFDEVYERVGGLDGLDWGIFSDGDKPAVEEMTWIGLELKRLYGSGFLVSAFVQPMNEEHLDFCNGTIAEGAVDYCTLEFFNRPGFDQEKIVSHVRDWADVIGEEHIMIGLAVHETEDHFHPQRLDEAVDIYREVKKLFPNIGGTNNWSIPNDFQQGNVFSTQVCTV